MSKEEQLISEIQSKVTIMDRAPERAHSTERLEEEDPITEINVTPLVDVALVLVIIFMAVSPFVLQAGLLVSESKAGAAIGKSALGENVQVTLTKDGKIQVNSVEVQPSDLFNVLKDHIQESKDGLVTLEAQEQNLVGQVVEILDMAKQAGAKKVAILNKKK
jgi:biopolymer transport protein ExbD